MERQCKYCDQKFENAAGRWFSNHVRWCDKNPKSSNTENIKLANKKGFDNRLGKITEFNVICNKCGNNFIVNEREKLFPEKAIYYCNRSCANSRIHSNATKNKIGQALSDPSEVRVCLKCNKSFEVKIHSKKRFCSSNCARQSKRSSNEFLNYRNDCKFLFNVWHHPDKFDLELIRKHGWYKAKNRGDNLNGVSRDHMISVMYGWENGVDPKIISHPANCKLMIHTENISKNKKCSLLLEELIKRIEEWDK